MKRIAALLILLAFPAYGKPCLGPSPSSSWGASFPQAKTIGGFTYDYANEILYANLPYINQYYTYLNVPYSVAYGFANTKTPDQYYQQHIKNIYRFALEAESCFALRTEDGKFLLVNP
ncbi:MAG: KTSC domain-containing protein [Thermoplasmata archaeon]